VSKVVAISNSVENPMQNSRLEQDANSRTTDHYRRILSELKLRPPSQRAFLRKLLHRALATGAPTGFPVVTHAVPNPVSPS
jgi:hypothetical protein